MGDGPARAAEPPLKLALAILAALWRSGLLRLGPSALVRTLLAWWRCGSSYAALAQIAAIRFPDRVALHDESGTLTFRELAKQADALADALLREHGLRAGDQAALLCRNHRAFVIGLVALNRLGVDVAVLGTESPPAALQRVLSRLTVSLILHDPDLAVDFIEPERRRSIDAPLSQHPARLPRATRTSQLIVPTSGSTGVPKGVRRRTTLRSVLPALAGLLENLPLQMHRPTLLAIPLNHGYGLTTLAMTLAMAAPLHLARRFEIGPLLARLPADATPVLVTVPTLLQRWLREKPSAPTFAAVISGSAPLEPALCTQAIDALGPVLFNLYGSTEGGLIALATPEALRAAPGTVGRPLPGTEVRLADRAGELGRIQVRGPLVLHADATGWFDTGDLGRLDAEGRLSVCGRADSMFVSGGENVYPEETEAALRAHPGVLEAAIAVVPDAEFGQRMEALVVAREPLDGERVREWLRERLERFKLPRRVHVVERIPRNALGKVDRVALLELQQKLGA